MTFLENRLSVVLVRPRIDQVFSTISLSGVQLNMATRNVLSRLWDLAGALEEREVGPCQVFWF